MVVVGADVVVAPAAAPAFAVVVVVGLAVVLVVVVADVGAWAAVTPRSAFWTFLLTACLLGLRQPVDVGLDGERLLAPGPEQLHRRVDDAGALHGVDRLGLGDPGRGNGPLGPALELDPQVQPTRKTMEMIPSAMMSVERPNQILRLPTKSNRVSPR